MKCLFVAVLIFLHVLNASPYQLTQLTNPRAYDRFFNDLLKDSVKTAVDSICPNTWDKFQVALNQSRDCCFDTLRAENSTVCMIGKNIYGTCINPVRDVFKDCLPEASKEIPQLVVDAQKNVINYVCSIDAEHLFEYYNPCVGQDDSESAKCSKTLQTKLEEFILVSFPSKATLCEVLTNGHECLKKHLTEHCGNPITIKSMQGLLNAFFNVCGTPAQNTV